MVQRQAGDHAQEERTCPVDDQCPQRERPIAPILDDHVHHISGGRTDRTGRSHEQV
jgi:hypothetical protein